MTRHWLSFSNADQSLLRPQTHGDLWDGLVVPGTLATYYKQGVGGFILSRRKPFVIDVRTPLIQPADPRPEPRASHRALAAVHHPEIELIWSSGREVPLEAWTPERWSHAVNSALSFQAEFERTAAEKIDKYEALLAEEGMSLDVDLESPIEGPERLIPPYWAVYGAQDPWWQLSLAAIEQGLSEYGPERLMPVLCLRDGESPAGFAELIDALPDTLTHVFCWRSSWDEADATREDIDGWLSVIDRAAMKNDLGVVNMYGGALSVLLTGLGLEGVNHGVGYSESRDSRRLGRTGAPPMRYYVPRLRQFLTVPRAQQALDELGDEWRCDCDVCGGRASIVGLSTEDLKRHFLLVRRDEFALAPDPQVALAALNEDAEELRHRFGAAAFDREGELGARGRVLRRWADALEQHV